MINAITPEHYAQILKINQEFVFWLSDINQDDLINMLSHSSHARQIDDAQAVIIAYASDDEYEHKNLIWLRGRFDSFLYIDRVIVDNRAQGKGYGRKLYEDLESTARERGYKNLVCEVNTKPDNPGSHKFHRSFGFEPVEEVAYPDYDAAVMYYRKPIDGA